MVGLVRRWLLGMPSLGKNGCAFILDDAGG